MFNEDIIKAIERACLEKEIQTLEFEAFSDNVSCLIMEHIIDCEDRGVEPDIMDVMVPQYPMCTGERVVRVGDLFQHTN